MKAFYQPDVNFKLSKIGHSIGFKLHFHHQVEFVYMLKGSGKALIDGTEYQMKVGDVLVVFPNQLHEYRAFEDEEYYIAIFKPEILPDFKDIFYNMIPESSVYSTNNENQLLYQTVVALSTLHKKDNKYAEQVYKGLLTAFFGELFSTIELTKNKKTDLSMIKSVLAYCNENYKKDISLNSVANELHISKYYVSHLLNDKLKLGFNDYVNTLRISDAVELLDSGGSDMTEIAQKSGFNTVRTFNRAFKSVYGVSPSQYKKEQSTEEN